MPGDDETYLSDDEGEEEFHITADDIEAALQDCGDDGEDDESDDESEDETAVAEDRHG